jgi:hypothetical protein
VVCWPEAALPAAAKTLAAAEVARTPRRVGGEEFLDMASLLGANRSLAVGEGFTHNDEFGSRVSAIIRDRFPGQASRTHCLVASD